MSIQGKTVLQLLSETPKNLFKLALATSNYHSSIFHGKVSVLGHQDQQDQQNQQHQQIQNNRHGVMSQELQEDGAHPKMVLETQKQTKQEQKMAKNTLWLSIFAETQGIEGKTQGIEGKT